MKKATWLIGLAAAALLASGAPLTLQAAGDPNDNLNTAAGDGFAVNEGEDSTNANSVAQLNITAGALYLTAVPNLNFDSMSVKNLIEGPKTLGLTTGDVDPNENGYDGNDDGEITVKDYRGTNAGWSLTAELGEFSQQAGATLTASSLTLDGALTNNGSNVSLMNSNIASGTASLLSFVANSGSGETTGKVASASLNFEKKANPVEGKYTAQIVWTLNATPSADSPTQGNE